MSRGPLLLLLRLSALAAWVAALDQGDVIGDDPDSELAASIEWAEIELDDQCQKLAAVQFQYAETGDGGVLERKAELWKDELRLVAETSGEYRTNKSVKRPDLVRKVQLVSYAGDALLPEEQRDAIVNFTTEIERIQRSGHVNCSGNSFDLSGVVATLAQNRSLEVLDCLWQGWHALFRSLQEDYLSVLELTNEIASENETPDPESYWLMVSEYPGSYEDARRLWLAVEPLYAKLVQYVASRLGQSYGPQGIADDVQPYLLGSLDTADWSAIADVVLGDDNKVYSSLRNNLQQQGVEGKKSYEMADKLAQAMGFQGLGKEFWEDSQFNTSCQTRIIEYCSKGETRVTTCSEATWPQFLEAHEVAMRAVRRRLVSEQSYLFVDSNRQSAVQEAAVGLLPLVAASAVNLRMTGLLSKEAASSSDAEAYLKLLVALRALPRLAYYLAADLWRLEMLSSENSTSADTARSWQQYRRDFQRIGASGNDTSWDFFPDEYIAGNKPYLAKFVGTILQFQLLELFENQTSNTSTVAKTIQEDGQLMELLRDGLSSEWPALLKQRLGIDGADPGALLRYFHPLEELLDGRRGGPDTGNRGLAGEAGPPAGANATVGGGPPDASDARASSIGSAVLIGCVVVALIGITATVFLVVRRRLKRNRSDYHLAKTGPE